MNQTLLLKDLQLLLKDLKFQVFFLILVVLFILAAISSAVTYQNLTAEYQKDLNEHITWTMDEQKTQMSNMLRAQDILKVFAQPSPAVLFSSFSNYPDKVKNGIMFYMPTFERYGSDTPVMFRLNWFFIFGILSGFIMLVMSFEAVSSERRSGTMRLMSVYGVRRQEMLWYKYISYMFLYFLVTIPPALVSMVLFFALSGIWSVGFMLKYLLMMLIAIPFASFFVWLGMFISMVRNYRYAIVLVIFVWLLFVIIIPQVATIIAKPIAPIKENVEYARLKKEAYDTEMEQQKKDSETTVWMNGVESKFSYIDMPQMTDHSDARPKALYASEEKKSQAYQHELNDSLRQTKLIRNISSISPFAQFERIAEILFDKGFYLFEHQQETTKRSITQISNLMRDQDSTDENSLHYFYPAPEIDFTIVRPFSGKSPFSEARFEHTNLLWVSDMPTDSPLLKTQKILVRLLPIILLNIVLIVCSVVRVERMDIR